MKVLAQIGAWHNSLDRMPAVILCISSVKLLFFITIPECMTLLKKVSVILFVTLNDQTAQTEKNSWKKMSDLSHEQDKSFVFLKGRTFRLKSKMKNRRFRIREKHVMNLLKDTPKS